MVTSPSVLREWTPKLSEVRGNRTSAAKASEHVLLASRQARACDRWSQIQKISV